MDQMEAAQRNFLDAKRRWNANEKGDFRLLEICSDAEQKLYLKIWVDRVRDPAWEENYGCSEKLQRNLPQRSGWGKVFIVAQGMRRCLIRDQIFTRQASARHANVVCWPEKQP
jgi:hypothetical protein